MKQKPIIIDGKQNYKTRSGYRIKAYEYKLNGLIVRYRTPAHLYKVNNQLNHKGKYVKIIKKLR